MQAAVTEQRPDLGATESEASDVGGNISAMDCDGTHAMCSVGGVARANTTATGSINATGSITGSKGARRGTWSASMSNSTKDTKAKLVLCATANFRNPAEEASLSRDLLHYCSENL